MSKLTTEERLELARRVQCEILAPMKMEFVGKDEIIDVLGVCLIAGENLFILGPPGTAKTALVHALGRRIEGRVFDYLLTRFTEPNELFGPFDIRKLREGELLTNTENMLPEADLAFLDELLNANSAILNSLLMVLNERIFRRGRETRKLPLLMVIGASNRLPEDEALAALFDRFLLRVRSDNAADERISDVLVAGWRLESPQVRNDATISLDQVRGVRQLIEQTSLEDVRASYVELILRLRRAGIAVSDRRAVKFQRLVAASAILCGRLTANTTDLWVLRYTWDSEEQREVIAAIVQDAVERSDQMSLQASHPRARNLSGPDPEEVARSLQDLELRLNSPDPQDDPLIIREQLALLIARCHWITQREQRQFLEQQTKALWQKLETPAA